MKSKKLKQLLTIALSVSVLCGATSAFAQATSQTEEQVKSSGESRINPEYTEWRKNGAKGYAPTMQNFSYLNKSYEKLLERQNYALLPEKYDMRDYGLVDSVSNQGNLSICWAVSANSAAFSTVIEQFPQEKLSPVHTAWFTFNGDAEGEFFQSEKNAFDRGGNIAGAVGTFAAWKGPVFENKAPVDEGEQRIPDESLRYDADFHLSDAYYMPHSLFTDDEVEIDSASKEVMKQLIMSIGSLSISYSTLDEFFNAETSAVYSDSKQIADHSTLVVGWDDNYSKNNFREGCRPKNDGAWLVKNSWGADWGNDGYFWLSYEDETYICDGALALEDKNNYAKNYQYDTVGWVISVSNSDYGDKEDENDKTDTYANIFTAESDEQLEAVGFYTADAGAQYSISVYTGVGNNKPTSGTLALSSQSGMEPYAGYHTIELENAVALKKGERFSIVVTTENSEYRYAVPVECWEISDKGNTPAKMGAKGESFILTNNGWTDVFGGEIEGALGVSNVCVKGFTNPLPQSGEAVSNVRFSKIEGAVAHGERIELESEGADEIYFSINGADFQKYSGKLKADFTNSDECVISAYAVKNGKQGNTITKIFTKATAQLTYCKMEVEGKYGTQAKYFDIKDFNDEKLSFSSQYESINISAQSSDIIKVNGEALKSNTSTSQIPIEKGETLNFEITVEGEGKNTSHHKIEVYRSMLDIDYKNETVSYDTSKYTVFDKDGNKISSGDSISHLISDKKTEVNVITADGESYTDYIPERGALKNIEIDYRNMSTTTSFSDKFCYSSNADMSDCRFCNFDKIEVCPGRDVYIKRVATETKFAYDVYHLKVPDKPSAPELNAVEITSNSIKLDNIGGKEQLYYLNGESQEWQSEPEFKNLAPDTEYRLLSFIDASDTHFISDVAYLTVRTKAVEEATQPPATLDEPDTVPPATEKPPVIEPSTDSATSDETAAVPLDSNGVQTGLQSSLYICVAVMLMFALIMAIGVNFKKKK